MKPTKSTKLVKKTFKGYNPNMIAPLNLNKYIDQNNWIPHVQMGSK